MTLAEIRGIWMAGFMASGEGWNGEWPFEHPRSHDPERVAEEDARLDRQFKDWLTNTATAL